MYFAYLIKLFEQSVIIAQSIIIIIIIIIIVRWGLFFSI